MNRRTFCGFLALAGAMSGLQPRWAWSMSGDVRRLAADRLVSLLRHRSSGAKIGLAYAAGGHTPLHPDRLVDDLAASLGLRLEDLAKHPDHEMRRRLRHRISEDFGQGRTLIVDGWVLGETEVRLCALCALQAEHKRPAA